MLPIADPQAEAHGSIEKNKPLLSHFSISKVTQEGVSSTVFLAKSTHEYIRLTSGYHYAILCVADILQVP